MMVLLIGIAGRTHAGKTTLANWLSHVHGWKVTSFAEPLRSELAAAWFRRAPKRAREKWSVLEAENAALTRPLLQAWGHGRRVIEHDDYWVVALFNSIDWDTDGVILIDDVRYPNEIAAILEQGGLIIRLHITEEEAVARGADPLTLEHASENAISHTLTLSECAMRDRVFVAATNDIIHRIQEHTDAFLRKVAPDAPVKMGGGA